MRAQTGAGTMTGMSGRTQAHVWRQLFRQKALPRDASGAPVSPTIRFARPEDEDALARLAQLDSSRPPRGLVVVAEVGGALWAAASVDDAHVVADPLRPTAELTWRLLDRGHRLRRARGAGRGGLPRVWPRALDPEPGLPDV